MKENKKKTIHITILTIFLIVSVMLVLGIGKVRMHPGVADGMQILGDSVMLDGRHMGWVNLNKFLEKAQKMPKKLFTASDYEIKGDSVVIHVRHKSYFYGQDEGRYWIHAYKNIPIRFTDDGFVAAVKKIDTVQYLYIPYQILSSVVSTAEPDNDVKPNPILDSNEMEGSITIKNEDMKYLPVPESLSGKKIQTEGMVLRNVSDILSRYPNDLPKERQMEILWKYAKEHWNYIYDPAVGEDMWRSASETIENYYFVDGRCYTGDCDDFAILMASFAKQIGYESRVRTAFNNEGGHAYAQFKDENGNWQSLDWVETFMGIPFQDTRGEGKVYYDI